jgi:hypothetical protein
MDDNSRISAKITEKQKGTIMTQRKAHPEKVLPQSAVKALAAAKKINDAYSMYIILNYRSTGSLAPGCDARDLIEWYRQNMPEEFAAKGGK